MSLLLFKSFSEASRLPVISVVVVAADMAVKLIMIGERGRIFDV